MINIFVHIHIYFHIRYLFQHKNIDMFLMTTRQARGKKFNSHPLIFESLQDVYISTKLVKKIVCNKHIK